MKSLRARWILPVDGPPIEDGVIAIQEGRIAFVGAAAEYDRAPDEDLGDRILLPGFINAHAHLELGWCSDLLPHIVAGMPSPPLLWDWFEELLRRNRQPNTDTERRQSIIDGAAESLAAGVTCIGDISRTGMNVELLAAAPIRKVCFIELISGARTAPNDAASLESRVRELQSQACDHVLCIGITPHAPYSVSASDLRAAAKLAAHRQIPLTMHVNETSDEIHWLLTGSGPAAEHLARYDLLRGETAPMKDAISYLSELGILALRPLLAHVNFIDDEQIARLAACGVSVAWCPRTHAYFGHPPHRWRELLAAGVNVCLGTDSLASSPSLSILDDIRHLRITTPDTHAGTLLEMATIRGAHALGFGHLVGSLSMGKLADLVAVPWISGGSPDPVENLIDGGRPVERVWLSGQLVSG